MRGNFEPALREVLRHEGGYADHPSDPGGRTNLGVTQRVWEDWTGSEVGEAEMRALTIADVTPLYRRRYWDAIRGDDLPAGVDFAVFDFAVNSGVNRAARFLQRIVGEREDGRIGARTLAAARLHDAADVIADLCALRLVYLRGLPIWPTFGRGWARRVKSIEDHAKGMVARPVHFFPDAVVGN